jgi:hypothetical protein
MKNLLISTLFVGLSSPAFASSPDCAEVKSNNPKLALAYEALLEAKNSAEAILENIEKASDHLEFIGFHFGSIYSTNSVLNRNLVRLDNQPLKTLPSEFEAFSKALRWERRNSWSQAINCYRGVFTYACDVRKGDKAQLAERLMDLVQAAKVVTESMTVRECLLR